MSSLLVAGVQNAHARGSYTLSVDSVNWKDAHQELTIKGKNEPGTVVYLYAGGTDHLLATLSTDARGRWDYGTSHPLFVPCTVRAESDGAMAEKETASAPPDCLAAATAGTATSSSSTTSTSSTTSSSTTNNPPVISGSPATSVSEGDAYTFTPSATDPDGDPLTFSILNRPAWASFDPATGQLSGVPGSNDAGSYSGIQISVADAGSSTSLEAFTITVADVNQPPTITGTPATSVAEGDVYTFTPGATDPDGDPLTFSISNRPAWASFDRATGQLSGVPGSNDAGSYSGIQISAADAGSSTSLDAFTITVANVNQPPTITGTPATSVAEGDVYTFTPGATDPDGDPLTFRILNRPAWSSFDPATGQLSGTPGSADVGVYENVVIEASDGTATSDLNPFTISVSATATTTGSATVSWVPPAARADGTPLALSLIGGYKIYIGPTPDNLTELATINDSSIMEYVANGLSAGTYHFGVTAYDTEGRESVLSAVAEKTIF